MSKAGDQQLRALAAKMREGPWFSLIGPLETSGMHLAADVCATMLEKKLDELSDDPDSTP